MSRAFVKEDAQPVEVQFRRASPDGPRLPLTLSGANRLKTELKALRDGADRQGAARIALLEETLARTEILDVRTLAGDQIRFGATVVLEDGDGTRVRYQIVGDLEANLKAGRVSASSPVARALIGREVGDSVQVQAPGGVREYEVLEVGWLEADAQPSE